MSEHIPKVSAGKFKVKVRVKGETDGPVFQGQKIVVPCKSCNPTKIRLT